MTSRTLAVSGGGTMGAGIAQVAAQSGWNVRIFDSFEGAADKGRQRIEKILDSRVKRGKLNASQFEAIMSNIVVSNTLEDSLKDADLFIEAILEDIKIKIVDIFEDQKWKVVGLCSNNANLKVKIVDIFEDTKIKIVDIFEDKKICITNANELDEDTLRMLKLID